MEDRKASRGHFSRLGWMFLLGTLIIYAAQLIPINIVKAVRPEWMENPDISLLLSVLPLYLIGMPLLILLVKKAVPAVAVEQHEMKPGQFAIAAILCFGLVYITNIVGNIFTFIIGVLKGGIVQNVIANVATSVSIWFVIIYMVLIAPIMEEYVFRKLIVDRTVRYGQDVAVVVSGLMFGLFHGNLNQFVYAFALGAFLAFLYVKTGKLKITIALHMMINFVGGVVSVLLVKMIDLESYLKIAVSGDMAALMKYVMNHLAGFVLYGVLGLFAFGMIIAGGVLMIVFLAKKRFALSPGEVVLPKGKRFSTVIFNPGMLMYCLFWIALIIHQLFV